MGGSCPWTYNFTSVAEVATGQAMAIFGVGFALHAYLKGGHSNPGIPSINTIFNIDNQGAEELMHVHDYGHHHDDPGEENGSMLEPGYGLVAIIALTPCILLMPLAHRAGVMGMAAVFRTIIVFFVATLAAILILVAACLKGLHAIRFEFFEKFGEVITGLIIGIMGVMVVAGLI